MVMYEVIKFYKGKNELVFVGSLSNAKKYVEKMRNCQAKGIKGKRVEYSVQKSDKIEKFKAKPHNINLSGQCKTPPSVIRKGKNQ